MGPQKQLVTFLVDTGAERTCVATPIKGCYISKKKTLDICGAKSEAFAVPIIENVTIVGNGLSHTANILYLPQAGINLLGRDFQLPFKIGVVPREEQMRTKLFVLSLEDEKYINPIVWAKPGNRGKNGHYTHNHKSHSRNKAYKGTPVSFKQNQAARTQTHNPRASKGQHS